MPSTGEARAEETNNKQRYKMKNVNKLHELVMELANIGEQALELAEMYAGEQTEASEGIRNLLWNAVRKIDKQIQA